MLKLPTFAPPAQAPNRHAANWLLAATVLVISYHLQHIPIWLSLTTGCLILWRYLVENHGWRPPGRLLSLVLLVIALLLVYRQYGTILGRDPGIGLLVLLCGLKLTELKKLRDYQFCVVLLYFLTFSAFLYSQSLLAGVYAFVVAGVTTIALARLNQGEALPAGQAVRLTGGLLVRALPIMLVMYFLFPRVHGGLWGVPEDAVARTGLSDRLELGQILKLLGDDRVALRVTFTGRPPPNRDLYWRSFVLTDSDGRNWSRPSNFRSILAPGAFAAIGETIEYTVSMEPHGQSWLVMLGLPRKAPPGTRLRGAYELEAVHRLRQVFDYRLQSYLQYRTGPLTEDEAHWNLRIPVPDPRIEELVGRWRTQGDARQVVRNALNYFREQGFRYTLSPPSLGADPVADFLFRTKAGYCEHFAAAFVTLMRSAGIPSRIVIGYQGGEMNPIGDYMIVRRSDAHAWAEVWLRDRGWTRVDPTTAVAPERIELGLDALLGLVNRGEAIGTLPQDQVRRAMERGWLRERWHGLLLRWDALNNAWNQWVKDYDPDAQAELLQLLGMRAPSWLKLVATAAVAVGLLLLVFAALLLYPHRRDDPAQRAYQKFCAKLHKLGLTRAPHEGPVDFAQRAMAARPDLRQQISAITSLYVHLRYRESDPAGIQALRRRVRGIRPGTAAPLKV